MFTYRKPTNLITSSCYINFNREMRLCLRSTIYLFSFITFWHFPSNFVFLSPSSANISLFQQSIECLFSSFIEIFILSLRDFFKDQNKWWSVNVIVGKYGVWIKTSQWIYIFFFLMLCHWINIIRLFLLTNSRDFSSVNFLLNSTVLVWINLSNSTRYTS